MEERSSIGQQQHHRLEKRHHHQQQHHHLPTPAEKLLKSSSTTTPHQYHHPFSGKADCTPPPEKDVVTPVITTVETKSVGVIGGGGGGEKVNLDLLEWPRIFLSLSRKEKEDDFFAMKGTKLPHRPKKRPKNIDKTLQVCIIYLPLTYSIHYGLVFLKTCLCVSSVLFARYVAVRFDKRKVRS